jgi:hypothetical protein
LVRGTVGLRHRRKRFVEHKPDNRERKVAGRDKRRGYIQGKRSYLHAMVNSIAKRAEKKNKKTP